MSNTKIKEIAASRSAFATRVVGSERLLVPVKGDMSEFNAMLTLNPSATLLWDHIDQETDVSTLTEVLVDNFEVNEETARKDVMDFINVLHEHITSNS